MQRLLILLTITLFAAVGSTLPPVAVAADRGIFDDALAPGWENWSWTNSVSFANPAPVQSGTASIAISFNAGFEGFSLRTNPPISAGDYSAIAFAVYGGAGGSQLNLYVQTTDDGAPVVTYPLTAAAGVWSAVNVPLSALGDPAAIARITLQDASGGPQPTFYVDQLRLIAATNGASPSRSITFPQSLAGVAVAPSGRLYVASWRESRIYTWPDAATATSTAAAEVFGTAMDPENPPGGAGCGAAGSSSFCGPESLAVDKAGNLYVAATYHNRVLIFRDPETDASPYVADRVIEGFNAPRGVALDGNGRLYVVDEFNYRVVGYDAPLTGDLLPDVIIGGTQGAGANQFQLPLGVAVDAANNLYVTDAVGQRVMRFDAPLAPGAAASKVYIGFSAPSDLAFDSAGNLYISDVVDFQHDPPNPPDSNNSRIAVITSPLTNDAVKDAYTDLAYPLGLSFDAAGNLYVALCVGPYPCSGAGRLAVFGAAPPAPGNLTLSVDAAAGQRPISPAIYGLHNADEAFAQEIGLPLRRFGGNLTTRYNWKNDASNSGLDYYFINRTAEIPADQFIARDRRTGTASLITMPMAGWVAKNADNGTCGFSVAKYGYLPISVHGLAPLNPDHPDCGTGATGRTAGGRLIFHQPVDPNDTSVPFGPAAAREWVESLVTRYGPASAGGVRYYGLDNEPDLWAETHADLVPVAPRYREFRDTTYQYAAAIKAADPGAQTLGPALGSYAYVFHSFYDGQREDWATPDDRNANGGTPFLAWYLQQMQAYEAASGTRLLDYVDVHWYPQNGAYNNPAGDAALQAARLESTRSLWDPSYSDPDWRDASPDNGVVQLIPRLKALVAANYPGTKIAISEYSWGAHADLNGALAQADVLGIFGREGVDLATLFDGVYENAASRFAPERPSAYAFRIYRNYDSAGGRFGDTSVQAASSDQGRLAIYAARRSADGALTLVVINKTRGTLSSGLDLAGFTPGGPAAVYRYSAANLGAIIRAADQPIAASTALSFPAESITLLVIPATGGAPQQTRLYLPLISR